MKKKSAWFGVTGLLLTVALMGAFFQSGEDLFQKALRLERNEGKLMEAIELYNVVVAEKENESLAAQAQLRIGFCYEKLGQKSVKQAQEAFQKVIDNFPGQSEKVRIAKERLSLLVRARTAPDDKGLRERQLLSGPELLYDGWLGAVSPDGRYVSIVDWKTNDLAIRDLTTGKKQRLTDQNKEEGYPLFSRWSPDGKRIVYDWWHGNSFVDLRIIGIKEKKHHTILKNEEIQHAWPLDWFPDGEHILIGMSKDDIESQIGMLSIEDGTTHIIKKGLEFTDVYLSPDGRYIAYQKPQEQNVPERDIYIYSIEEGKESLLIEHPANDEILGWSPDGQWILFRSSRLGSDDAWIIPVSNGKTEGDPRLVKKGIEGIASMGFSRDGSFYYMNSDDMENIYTAYINPETEKIQILPEKMDLPIEGRNGFPVYSPDGKKLAYLRGALGSWLNQSSLHIRSLESGQEQVFTLGMKAYYPRWSPDGRTILLTGSAEHKHRLGGISRIEVLTGAVKSLLLPEHPSNERYRGNEWAPDGKSFYFVRQKLGGEPSCQIYRYYLETGKKEKIHQTASNITISLSPNGRWLAFIGREIERELKIIPLDGGELRVLCRFNQRGGAPISLVWTPDSQYVLFFKKTEKDVLGEELCRVSVTGGKVEELGLSMISADHLRIHPNGNKMVFSSLGFSIPYPEFWVMENFLPKSKNMK